MKKIYITLFLGLAFFNNVHSKNNNHITVSLTNKNITKKVVLRDKCDIVYDNVYKDVYDHGGTASEAKAIASAARCACRETLTQAQQ